MTMQRRHFELIAEAIAELDDDSQYNSLDVASVRTCKAHIADVFARHLRATNPNFNRVRFLRACGVEGD